MDAHATEAFRWKPDALKKVKNNLQTEVLVGHRVVHGRNLATMATLEIHDPTLDEFKMWCYWNIEADYVHTASPYKTAELICDGQWLNKDVSKQEAKKLYK